MDDFSHSHTATQRLSADSNSGLAFTSDDDGRNLPHGIVGFPFDQIFDRLDGEDPDFAVEVKAATAEAVKRLLAVLVRDNEHHLREPELIGRQLLALVTVAGLESLSYKDIGDRSGVSKQAVGRKAAEVNRNLGLVGVRQQRLSRIRTLGSVGAPPTPIRLKESL